MKVREFEAYCFKYGIRHEKKVSNTLQHDDIV